MELVLPPASLNVKPEDYVGEDGLIYCANCHTPKQHRIALAGRFHTVPCLCTCKAQEKAQREEQERLRRIEKRKEDNRMFAFYDYNADRWTEAVNWTFENDKGYNHELAKKARNYFENFEHFKKQGTGLLLYGMNGTGKTFYSCCIANALIDKGYRVLFTSFQKIANNLFMEQDKQGYIDSLCRYSAVFLDDMDTERDTDYMSEVVFAVIDGLSVSGTPAIITTNLSSQDLKNAPTVAKRRVYSRLMEMCIPIPVKGEDLRAKIGRERYTNDLKILLGDGHEKGAKIPLHGGDKG